MSCLPPQEPPPPCFDCEPPPPTWPPPPVRRDPVAQSFKMSKACFITSIDLWFSAIDTIETAFWVAIRRMEDGVPVSENLYVKDFSTEDVTPSATAATVFNAKFDYPVFVEGDTEYCFVVGGWTPKTRLWFARLGEQLIDDETKVVETQPVTGSSFRSQNGVTWTPEQFEDIKYKIYIAKFDTDKSMDVSFDVIDSERELLPEDPFECEIGNDMIRVYYPDHGLVSGDKFTISMFEDTIYSIKVDATKPLPVTGATLYAQSGRGVINTIETEESTGKVRVKFSSIVGRIVSGEKYNTETMPILNSKGQQVNNIIGSSGSIEDAALPEIAGILVEELVGENFVEIADTPDSFLFRIGGTKRPTSAGRFGGRNVFIDGNFKYEVFNFSGNYMLYGGSERWFYTGVGHNPDGGIFKGQDYVEDRALSFVPSSDVFLTRPYKHACAANIGKIKTGNNVRVRGIFQNTSAYNSPIINMNTFSNTMISNRVGWLVRDDVDVSPNASDRYIEEVNFNGSEPYKYVTKHVTLKNPATDLMILFDCYKDKDADFDVYYKVIYTNAQELIDEVQWIRIPISVKRDSSNWNEKFEYELLLSDAFGAAYAFNEFSTFKVKLVGRSKNSAKPPIFGNLRVIAVT